MAPPETLDSLVEGDKQKFTIEEVTPSPGVTKGPNQKAFHERVSNEGGVRSPAPERQTRVKGMSGQRRASCIPRSADMYDPCRAGEGLLYTREMEEENNIRTVS